MSKNIVSYIDESGNFDFSKQGSCFYILSFVFISPSVPTNELFKNVKCKRFHAAPIIRGKDEFENLDIITRKKMFRSMATLAETAPASYKSFIYDKKYFSSKGDLLKKIRKDLYSFFNDPNNNFSEFNSLELRYDGGQKEISNLFEFLIDCILSNSLLTICSSRKERIFELADYVSEMALLDKKLNLGILNKSELGFFERKELKKNYLRPLVKKSR